MSPAGKPSDGLLDKSGFTLLELLVVLSLVAVVLVFAVPAMRSGGPQTSARAVTGELAAVLRLARSEAIRQNRDMGVSFDMERRVFTSQVDGLERPLPPEADIALVTAGEELREPRTGRIRFFTDGSSTGGRITMTIAERSYHVNVEWLTGGVAIGR